MKVLTIDGHLGKDAEIMKTPKGVEFISLSIANTTYVKGEDKTVWYDVTFFNVENLRSRVEYLKKGSYVSVTGLPDESGYLKKDGNIIVNHSLLGDRIEFLRSGKRDNTQQDANYSQNPSTQNNNGYIPPMAAPNPAPAQPSAQYQQPAPGNVNVQEPQIVPQTTQQPIYNPSIPQDVGDELPF